MWTETRNAGQLGRDIGPVPVVDEIVTHEADVALSVQRTPADTEYDEVDRRLMDTFPASDAIGRYGG